MKLIWGDPDPETNMFAKLELVELLTSEDPETRRDVMCRLGISGEGELLPFLRNCLTHQYKELRSATGRVLAHLGDDTVLFHFVDALEEPDFRVRYEAEKAILAFDDSNPLVRHMQSYIRERGERGRPMRIASIEGLEELGDERAVPFLIGALSDADRNVREAAADALGTFGSERAVPALLGSLEENYSARVVFAAGRALGRIGGEQSLRGLMERLSYLDTEPWMSAVMVLGEIGDGRAIEYIVETLPDKPHGAMRGAERALKALGDGDLVTRLLSALEGADNQKRECAALALGLLGDLRALDLLARALNDSDGYIAEAAAKALGWLGDGGAFQPLADALSHSDYEVRGAAVDALERLGDIRAIEVLERFIDDKENDWLRWRVGQVLKRLRESE
ncbi:MAG: HEAT repeat domain-containing protein [Chloroflexota bacterium]|nr:HEAT repeat domain-containing protein [Chloroflexota bacterium]